MTKEEEEDDDRSDDDHPNCDHVNDHRKTHQTTSLDEENKEEEAEKDMDDNNVDDDDDQTSNKHQHSIYMGLDDNMKGKIIIEIMDDDDDDDEEVEEAIPAGLNDVNSKSNQNVSHNVEGVAELMLNDQKHENDDNNIRHYRTHVTTDSSLDDKNKEGNENDNDNATVVSGNDSHSSSSNTGRCNNMVGVARRISNRRHALPLFHRMEEEEGRSCDDNDDDERYDHMNNHHKNYKTTGLDDDKIGDENEYVGNMNNQSLNGKSTCLHDRKVEEEIENDEDEQGDGEEGEERMDEREDKEEIGSDTMYSSCPLAGIVCNLCQLRITASPQPNSSIQSGRIRYHERYCRRHTFHHDTSYTKQVVKDFLKEMDDIANKVIAAPTLDDARNVIIEYLKQGSFWYFAIGNKLVHNTAYNRLKYNGGETRQGYKSKKAIRTSKHAIILPTDFDFVKCNLCSDLWKILMRKNLPSRLLFWNETKTYNGSTISMDVGCNRTRKEMKTLPNVASAQSRPEQCLKNQHGIYNKCMENNYTVTVYDDKDRNAESVNDKQSSSSIMEEPEGDDENECNDDEDKVDEATANTIILYSYCPLVGIVCNLCQVAVDQKPRRQTYPARIGAHERCYRRHSFVHDMTYRKNVVKEFLCEMDKIGNEVIAAKTIGDARNVIFYYLEKGSFLYCPGCSKFVSAISHPCFERRKCTEWRQGYKSKGTRQYSRKAIILSMDFDFIKRNFCPDFWEILLRKNLPLRLMFWNNSKTYNGSNRDKGTDSNRTRKDARTLELVTVGVKSRLMPCSSDSIMDKALAPLYSICPVGGITCNTCQHHISSYTRWKIYHRSIRHHEHASSYSCHLSIVNEFDAAMELLATMIITAPTLQHARGIIIQNLEEGFYHYCLECSTFDLQSCSRRPNSQNHSTHRIERRLGYKSKMWKNNCPLILQHDFALTQESLCSALWEKLQEKDLNSCLKFWNCKNFDNNDVDSASNRILSSTLDIGNGSDMSYCVFIDPDQTDGDKIRKNAVGVIDNADTTNQSFSADNEDEVEDGSTNGCAIDGESVNELSDISHVGTNTRADLANIALHQKLEEMEQRLCEKISREHQEYDNLILNRMNDKDQYRREMDELKSIIQYQNSIILNRFVEIEQKLKNTGRMTLQENAEVTLPNVSEQESEDMTTLVDDTYTTPPRMIVSVGTNETNPTLITAQKYRHDDNGNFHPNHSRQDQDQRLQEMELQLRQLARERDQLMAERNEAVSLTEDMEKELYRLSQELDHFTDVGKTVSAITTDGQGMVAKSKNKKQRIQY